MKQKSIRSHLKHYSIFTKRRTTIAHAFASALAPSEIYDEKKVSSALTKLGQADLKRLTCVYCEEPAQTWDHLSNLVKAGEFSGFGHQVGNLVPSCRDCNSSKGSMLYDKFVESLKTLTDVQKKELMVRLSAHQDLAQEVDMAARDRKEVELLKEYREIQDKVLQLLKDADNCASRIRNYRGALSLHRGAIPRPLPAFQTGAQET